MLTQSLDKDLSRACSGSAQADSGQLPSRIFCSPSPPLHTPYTPLPLIISHFLIPTCTLPPLCLCPGSSLLANSPPPHPHIHILPSLKDNSRALYETFPDLPESALIPSPTTCHSPIPKEDRAVPVSERPEHHALSTSLL